MSFDTVKSNLEKEGASLLSQLKEELSEDLDLFRSNFSVSFIDEILTMRHKLIIAESIALHEQLQREGKPTGATSIWNDKYENYLRLEQKYRDHSSYFIDKEDIKDFKDELNYIKNNILETAPSGSVRPDLKSTVRILDFVRLEMELDEDLYFDVKTFLKRSEMYQHMVFKDGILK